MRIKINDEYYIEQDERFFTFTPFYFQKGTGEKVKVAGREVESKDKWISSGQYLNSLPAAVKWIADHKLATGGDLTLDEYVREYRAVVAELTEKVGVA